MPIITHEIETRGTLRATEVRASKAAGKFELTGRCASYNTPTKINDPAGAFMEQVAPGAFSRSLREGADVKATFNHDPNHILGCTKSGTLKLQDSEDGLLFRCILDPNNTTHQMVHSSVSRGDHSECSFAFKVPPGGDTWTTTKDETGRSTPLRTLKDVDLVDVAPAVTYPAYGGTATQVSARTAAQRTSVRRGTPQDPPAVLQAASDAARRSVARVQARKLEADADRERRAKAARLGRQVAAEDAQEKSDSALRERMQNAAGIVYGRN
ncbi:MAG: HK97 family phage prohead protease [Candidatus Sulfotelmatobacter sp.]